MNKLSYLNNMAKGLLKFNLDSPNFQKFDDINNVYLRSHLRTLFEEITGKNVYSVPFIEVQRALKQMAKK